MPTLNQLIRHGREEKRRADRTRASDQCPQKQGVRPRVSTRTPKKPNSALRVFYGLNRGGRVKDLPGVKSHCIQGVKDLLGILDRRSGRSKYGSSHGIFEDHPGLHPSSERIIELQSDIHEKLGELMINRSPEDVMVAAEALHAESENISFLESLLNNLTINGVQGEAYTDALDLAGGN
ncbi:hypothetical protein ACSBR2_033341 [Camellia fascicularis]